MPVTNECAGLKIAGVCYTMGFIGVITELDDDDDSLSNLEPGSEGDGGQMLVSSLLDASSSQATASGYSAG